MDITMCSGNNCELSSTCYRYKAEPSQYRQSYFCKPPNNNLECDYYWEMDTKLTKDETEDETDTQI